MSQPRRYFRTFAFAGCLPYVVWCVLGQWIHGLTGCCEAHPHLHIDAAAHQCTHAHRHSHARCNSSPAPDNGPRFGEGRETHVHACPFCDFVGQAQSFDVGPPTTFVLAAGALAPLPVAPPWCELFTVDHPGRGPPRV